jgi:GWxTD domain-containing protein
MNTLTAIVRSPFADALGWTVLHSFWQGALVALVLLIALRATLSARIRYAAACIAMGAALTAFFATLARLLPESSGMAAARWPGIAFVNWDALDPSAGNGGAFRIADVVPWLAPLWAAGTVAFYLRMLAGWVAAQRLTRRGICASPAPWQHRLDQLRARMRVSRPVVLVETCLADVPVVTGWLRPVIIIPAGVLAGIPVSQVEAILLHELAHIRRCDYLVNVLQAAARGILFYHPAIWWVSRIIHSEREHCCDDLVVSVTGDPYDYAAALTSLEQSRWNPDPALAATGGNLVTRIRRLLYPSAASGSMAAVLLSAGALALASAGVLAAWQAQPAPKDTPYQKWVAEDVAYIIGDQERAAFERLRTDEEREHFIEQFWLRRDPTPGTSENEFKMEHYRRIAYANQRFAWSQGPGWKTDRGRVYIIFGPPDEIESHPSGGGSISTPWEDWRYRYVEGLGSDISFKFLDRRSTGEYLMVSGPSTGKA